MCGLQARQNVTDQYWSWILTNSVFALFYFKKYVKFLPSRFSSSIMILSIIYSDELGVHSNRNKRKAQRAPMNVIEHRGAFSIWISKLPRRQITTPETCRAEKLHDFAHHHMNSFFPIQWWNECSLQLTQVLKLHNFAHRKRKIMAWGQLNQLTVLENKLELSKKMLTDHTSSILKQRKIAVKGLENVVFLACKLNQDI